MVIYKYIINYYVYLLLMIVCNKWGYSYKRTTPNFHKNQRYHSLDLLNKPLYRSYGAFKAVLRRFVWGCGILSPICTLGLCRKIDIVRHHVTYSYLLYVCVCQ